MDKLKKLVQKKYFYMIFFAILLITASVVLYFTIQHDVENSTITDDMFRVYGTVNEVYGHTESDDQGNSKMQYDVIMSIELENGKKYDEYPMNNVPKCNEGDKIKLKYDKDFDSVFYLAEDPEPNYRIGNYIICVTFILISLSGLIMASKVLDYLNHRRLMALKAIEDKKNTSLDSHGIDYNSTDAYNGYDGSESGNIDLNPFADNNIDYNALYDYDKKMDDASYSAENTYSGYGAPSNNPMDAPYNPTDTYSGYGTPSNNPMDAPYNPTDTYSGYGAPSNNPMDAPYNPTDTYSGYGAPSNNQVGS